MTGQDQSRDSRGRFVGRALSDDEVDLLINHARAGETHGSLARRFGVDRSLVTRLVNGQRRRRRKEGGQES